MNIRLIMFDGVVCTIGLHLRILLHTSSGIEDSRVVLRSKDIKAVYGTCSKRSSVVLSVSILFASGVKK